MLNEEYPGMAAAPIVDPGASSLVVEPRLIRDRETTHRGAFLVGARRAWISGRTATATNAGQRHGNGSKNKLTVGGSGSSSPGFNGNGKEERQRPQQNGERTAKTSTLNQAQSCPKDWERLT